MEINVNKTFCFTGHRPNKLYGYNRFEEGNIKLRNAIKDSITYMYLVHGIDTFISGMALGWDLWAAEIVLELQNTYPIKLICAVPCKEHDAKFSYDDKKLYSYIIENANYVHNVTGLKYFPRCMQIRNKWMVNSSCGQIVGWDGTRGGTFNCINYANSKNKKNRITVNPKTLKVEMFGV
jgi:uncharacterized phage-like protein YoqJ